MGVPGGHGLVRTSHGKAAQVMTRIECKLVLEIGTTLCTRLIRDELFIIFWECSVTVYRTLAGSILYETY